MTKWPVLYTTRDGHFDSNIRFDFEYQSIRFDRNLILESPPCFLLHEANQRDLAEQNRSRTPKEIYESCISLDFLLSFDTFNLSPLVLVVANKYCFSLIFLCSLHFSNIVTCWLGGGIRLALAQYRELAAFSQFASDLDEATRKQLERGERVMEMMKQAQYQPMSVAEMALSLFAANEGYLDDISVDQVVAFENAMQAYVKSNSSDLMDEINRDRVYSDEIVTKLHAAVEDFKKNGSW